MSDHMLKPIIDTFPAGMDPASREGVMHMEAVLNSLPVEMTEGWEEHFPNTHQYADNVYGRGMSLPAGGIIVGKIHRYGHFNVLLKGKCIVLTEFGVERLEAPCMFVSKPGTKRVVGVIEDTEWVCFHGIFPNEVDRPDLIEERIICKTFGDYDRLTALEDKP